MDRAARGMLDVARSVLAELDLEVVLERVLASARDLTGARYAALGVLGESGGDLDRFLTLGMDDATRDGIGELPRGRGVLGELISDPAPLRLAQVGRHPRSYGFPAAHPPMDTFLGVPILVRGRPYGNLYLTEKEGGSEFTQADEEAVVLLAEFAGVAIDHAGRYTGAESRRDELERTVAALEATTQIARAVGGETDLDVVLELVAKRGRALVSARTLLIELEQGESLVVAAGAGEFPEGVLGERVALRETVASAALRTRRTQHLEDELNRSRFEQHGLGRLGVKAESGLVVPLVFRPTRTACWWRSTGSRRVRIHGRGPAAAGGLRDERRDRRLDRRVGRRRAAPPAPQGGRGRAGPVGPRAARRDAPEPGRRAAAARVEPRSEGTRGARGGRWRRDRVGFGRRWRTSGRSSPTCARPCWTSSVRGRSRRSPTASPAGASRSTSASIWHTSRAASRPGHGRARDGRVPDRPGGADERVEARSGRARGSSRSARTRRPST